MRKNTKIKTTYKKKTIKIYCVFPKESCVENKNTCYLKGNIPKLPTVKKSLIQKICFIIISYG